VNAKRAVSPGPRRGPVCGRIAVRSMLAVLSILLLASSPLYAAIPVYGFKVVHRYPHDSNAFTEGLFYRDGFLYESTGMEGASSVRKVALRSGKVVQQSWLPPKIFGEGIVAWKDRLIQLTWRQHMGLVYDLHTLKPVRLFRYPGEGWALTRHGDRLYMSDGTPNLRVLDADTLRQIGTIHVTADGQPVHNLNELEWVDGQLFANIWQSTRIARIDPATGHVVGWIELKGLLDVSKLPNPEDDVLNGIAWDAEHRRLFVTGKCWPTLFQIRLVPPRQRRVAALRLGR
jgi:glutaminyl-peptide cyclotransferase